MNMKEQIYIYIYNVKARGLRGLVVILSMVKILKEKATETPKGEVSFCNYLLVG